MNKQLKLLFLSSLLLSALKAQDNNKKGFEGMLSASALFCQVDGDQASGYNKFGYSAGYMIKYYFGKKYHYETGILFSNRGSARAFDPDNPGLPAMNLNYNYVDIPIALAFPVKKFELAVGIRTGYLIGASDKQMYVVNLREKTRSVGMLGTLEIRKKIGENLALSASGMYSLFSIRNGNNGTVFRNSGVFHNNLSLGILYSLGGGN